MRILRASLIVFALSVCTAYGQTAHWLPSPDAASYSVYCDALKLGTTTDLSLPVICAGVVSVSAVDATGKESAKTLAGPPPEPEPPPVPQPAASVSILTPKSGTTQPAPVMLTGTFTGPIGAYIAWSINGNYGGSGSEITWNPPPGTYRVNADLKSASGQDLASSEPVIVTVGQATPTPVPQPVPTVNRCTAVSAPDKYSKPPLWKNTLRCDLPVQKGQMVVIQ